VRVEFHPEARDEFVAAVEYYDIAVSGLGDRFLIAIRRTIDLALAHPEAGTPRGTARRLLVAGFPYDVVYRVRDDVLDILAVAHHHRRPGYWRRRTRGEHQ
jgi:plasmid stabilization system protein ParE